MTEPSWDDVRLFLAAMETGSLSAAARRLGLGQATLSRRLSALEDQLGHVLFDRSRRGLAPTAAADALRPHAEAMAQGARAGVSALDALDAEPAGLVRLAVTEAVAVDLIPGILPELARRWPRVRLEVLADLVAVDLGGREADIAIRAGLPEGGDLVARRMPDAPMRLYGAPAWVASLPEGCGVDDVPLVQLSDEHAGLPWARAVARLLNGRAPSFVSNSELALRAAAAAGAGAFLSWSLEAHAAGLVPVPVALPPDLFDAGGAWYLLVPRPLRKVPRVAAVVDLLLEAVASGLAEDRWPPPGFARTMPSSSRTTTTTR